MITFVPTVFLNGITTLVGIKSQRDLHVTGQVVYVNQAHRWYRVKFNLPGCMGYECFKF